MGRWHNLRRLESALNVLMYELREVSKVFLLDEYAANLGTSRRKEYRGRHCDELTTITVSKKSPFIWSIQQNRKTSVSSVSLIAVLAKN